MTYVEAEGNSIDEAIERALNQLGVGREKAEIEILSDAARGLFGIGGRKARVRATVRAPLDLEGEATRQVHAAEVPRRAPEPQARRERPRPQAPERSLEAEDDGGRVPDAAALERGRGVLEQIVRHIAIDATVGVEQDADGARLSIVGDTSGILIGRRGQTLDALEYLVNRIVARGEMHSGRIVVDCENYRARRRELLEAMALGMAEEARRRGRPVTLNPMNPRDRRIVHMALRNDPTLVTRSSGTGYLRKLLIVPAAKTRGQSP